MPGKRSLRIIECAVCSSCKTSSPGRNDQSPQEPSAYGSTIGDHVSRGLGPRILFVLERSKNKSFLCERATFRARMQNIVFLL